MAATTKQTAALATMATFTAAATDFSAAASDAMTTGSFDSSLLQRLNALPDLCSSAISALRAAFPAPEVADTVTGCELTLAKCSALGDSLLATRPPVSPWTVPGDMTEIAILQRFYGSDGPDHIVEFESNNPAVVGLIFIPPGTVLNMVAATV